MLAFSRFIAKRFNDDQCFEAAGALSFTTVFAMVPLFTVALSVFASFQQFGRFRDSVIDWVFAHFVPTSGAEIEGKFLEFIDGASTLTGVGTIALFISGLLLMTSIEHSFNRIWRVVAPRRALARFVVFWIALTLGPLLVGAGLAVSSALLASPYLSRFAEHHAFEAATLALLPLAVTLAAATLAYLIIPNAQVRLRHAVFGGMFTAAAFEVAKAGFAQFIGQFASYQQIYGTVTLIPVFLLWIYISWVVALLGASLTAAMGAFTHEASKRDLPERERFPALLRLLGRLREAQVQGIGLSVVELAGRLPDVPEATIAGLLGLACAADFTEYLLWEQLDEPQREQLRREGMIRLPCPYGEPYLITLKLIEEAKAQQVLNRAELPIDCPVCLIHGMMDTDVPWRTSLQVMEKLTSPDVRLILVKDGEHTLSRDQDLRLLTRTLGEMLEGR